MGVIAKTKSSIEEATGYTPIKTTHSEKGVVLHYTPAVCVHISRGSARAAVRHVVGGTQVMGPLRAEVKHLIFDLQQAIEESEA